MAAGAAYAALIIAVGSAIYASNMAPDDKGGTQLTKQGSQNSRNRVYGKCIVGCTNAYTNVLNRDRSYRLDVFAVGGVGVLKFHNIWIEDKKMFASDKNEVTVASSGTSGFYADSNMQSAYQKSKQFLMQWRSGQEDQVAASLAVNNSDNEWASTAKGAMVPHIVIYADFTDNQDYVIFGDRYQIQALVTAEDIYDTRTQAVDGDSSNPALAIYDFLTSTYFGMGIQASYIDTSSFNDVANSCESENLTINTEIDGEAPYSETLENMLATFGGSLVIQNGLIKILFEEKEATTLYSFDESNIIESTFSVKSDSSSNYYNVISATYKSEVNFDKEDDYVIPSDAVDQLSPSHENYPTRIFKDGEIIPKTIKLPFVRDAYEEDGSVVARNVKWLANREYIRSNFQTLCSFEIDLLDYPDLGIWSVIDVTHSVYGWTNKKFRVTSMQTATDANKFNIAKINLSEYDDSIYEGNLDGVNSQPYPVQSDIILPPTALSFTLETYVTNGFGTLSWTPQHFTSSSAYDVDYKLSNEPTWTRLIGAITSNEYLVYNLKIDSYDFRVRTHDTVLGTSDWVLLEDQVIDIEYTLPPIQNLAVDTSSSVFAFTWSDAMDYPISNAPSDDNPNGGGSTGLVRDVFDFYRVTIYKDSVAQSTHRVTDPFFNYTFEENTNSLDGINRTVTASVVIVDGTAAVSTSDLSVEGTNPQITAPTSVTVDNSNGDSQISWQPRLDSDFAGSQIFVSTTSGFTPGAGNLYATIGLESNYIFKFPVDDSETRYARLSHFDVFGTGDEVFSGELTLEYVGGAQSAQSLSLSATSQIFKESSDGSIITPSSITIDANRQNIEQSVVWSTNPEVVYSIIDDDTISITSAAFGSNGSVQVTGTAGSYSDYMTIIKLKDGSGSDGSDGVDSMYVVISNESHSIPTDADGSDGVYTNSGTTVSVYEGTTQLQYDAVGTTPETWALDVTGSSITAGSITISGYNAVVGDSSNMVSDIASVLLAITGRRENDAPFSINKYQSLTKSRSGAGAKNIKVTVDTQAFLTDGLGVTTPTDITLTAVTQNIDDTTVWTTSPSVTLVGSGLTRTLSKTNFGSNNYVTVTVSSEGVSDTMTIYSLSDGTDGIDGLQGDDGLQGIPGTDGTSTYFHIAYADDAFGTNFSQDAEDKNYIGTYVDYTATDAAASSSLWQWQLVRGIDGDNGIAGANGANGQTSYLHIAYANNSTGSSGFDTSNSSNKIYIGQYTDFVSADSTTASDYNWTKIRGDDGADGANGIDGTNGTAGAAGATTYFHIAYADDDAGGGFSQSPTDKVYIGTYVDYTLADSSTASDYTWSRYTGQDSYTNLYHPTISQTQIPQNSTIDTGLEYTFDSEGYAGTVLLKLLVLDAEGSTCHAGFNGTDLGTMTGGNNESKWYTFTTEAVDGTNTINLWVTNADGASIQEISVSMAGADGSSAFTLSEIDEATITPSSVTCTSASSSWNSAAKSLESLDDGCFMSCTAEATAGSGLLMVGLSNSTDDSETDYSQIDYAIYITTSGVAVIYESNSWEYNSNIVVTDTDVLMVKNNGLSVKYYINGVSFYTSAVIPSGAYHFRCSLRGVGTAVKNVSFGSTGIAGIDGSNGIAGTNGTNGATSYFHTAYATSSDGSSGFNVVGYTNATYIGTYVDFTIADSTTASDYTWVLIKGSDGASDIFFNGFESEEDQAALVQLAGDAPVATTDSYSGSTAMYITSTTTSTDASGYGDSVYLTVSEDLALLFVNETIQISVWAKQGANPSSSFGLAYSTSEVGNSGFTWFTPTDAFQKFTIEYYVETPVTGNEDFVIIDADALGGGAGIIIDNVSVMIKPIDGVDGTNGLDGTNGAAGSDGNTSYFHIAYANDDSGTGFSQTSGDYEYVGTYVDFTLSDSNDPADYDWVLIKGSDAYSNLFIDTAGGSIPNTTDYAGGRQYTFDSNGWVGGIIIKLLVHDAEGQVNCGLNGVSLGTMSGNDLEEKWYTFYGESVDGTNEISLYATGADGSTLREMQVSIAQSGADGTNGLDGSDGAAGGTGADGNTSYFHIAYADDASGTGFSQSPTGKTYIGTYVDFNSADSASAGAYTWVLIAGSDGASAFTLVDISNTTLTPTSVTSTTDSDWSGSAKSLESISDGCFVSGTYVKDDRMMFGLTNSTSSSPSYSIIDYAIYVTSSYTVQIRENGEQIATYSTVYDADTVFMVKNDGLTVGYYADGVLIYTSEEIPSGAYRFMVSMSGNGDLFQNISFGPVGLAGLNGSDGINGVNGTNGESSYFHIAYATNSIGSSGFSTTDSTNKTYIGTYVDDTIGDSNTASDYNWSLIKGADGSDGSDGTNGTNGIAGTNGTNGATSYFHTAYADTILGAGFSQSSYGKSYIGVYVDFTQADSSSASAYEWSRINGSSNLLTNENWVVGDTGSVGLFSKNGATNYNTRVLGVGPMGFDEVLWYGNENIDSGAGGWAATIPVDHEKSYRVAVWIKTTSNSNSTYLGCHGSYTNNLNGTENTNPYFWSGDLPSLNKWYLLVGIIHGSGHGTTDTGVAGIYDPVTGLQVVNATEFKNKTTATYQRHRTYRYYASDSNGTYWARPRFEEINGEEMSLEELMNRKAESAFTVILSNESHTIPASYSGVPSSYAGSGTTVKVFEGTNQLTYGSSGTADGTYIMTASGSSVSAGSVTDSGVYGTLGSCSAMSSDTAYINITISGTSTNGNAFSFVRTQSLTLSRAGSDGVDGSNGASSFTMVNTANCDVSVPATVTNVGSGAWANGAQSAELLDGACYMSCQVPSTNKSIMIGLSNDTTNNSNFTTIDFAIYFASTNVYVYENGASKGVQSTTTIGSTYMVRNNGELVEYLKDGVVFYTSLNIPSGAYRLDMSLHTVNASVTNIAFGGSSPVRGSKQYYATTTGTVWSDAIANAAITNSGDVRVFNDIVTISNTSSGFAETRFWDKSTSPDAWTKIEAVIDGSLLVRESITSDSLATGAITAEKLAVSSTGSETGNSSGVAVTIDPYADSPITITNTSTGANVFSVQLVDGDPKATVDGYAGVDFISSASAIADDVKVALNPYYLGAGGSYSNTTSAPMTSLTPTLTSTSIASGGTNTINFAFSAHDFSQYYENWDAPKWQINVRRNNSSGELLHSKTYTGTATNIFNGTDLDEFSSYSITIEDGFVDTASPTNEVYNIQCVRVSGEATSLTRTLFSVESPSFEENALSKSTIGYWKDKDTGFTIQWGYKYISGNSSSSVTFPVAFSSACTSVVVNIKDATTGGRDGWGASYFGTTSTTLINGMGSSETLNWIATGY